MSNLTSFVGGLLVGVIGLGSYLHYNSQQKKREKETLINQLKLTKSLLDDKNKLFKEREKELTKTQELLTEEKCTMETHEKNFNLVLAIGFTGWGKSTLCNRLIGDTTTVGDMAGFTVNHGVNSGTKNIIEKSVIFDNKKYIIVDVPGFGDSDTGNEESIIDNTTDIFHSNKVIRYLNGSGGVSAFLLVVSLREERFSRELIILLKDYLNKFLTEKKESKIVFWKHVIMVFTNSDMVDTSSAVQQKSKVFCKKIKDEFKLEFDLHFVIFGKNRFKHSIKQLMRLVPNSKYCTKEMRLLSDELISKTNQKEEQQKQLKTDIQKLEKQEQNIEIQIKYSV